MRLAPAAAFAAALIATAALAAARPALADPAPAADRADAAPATGDDASANDLRCIVVAGALLQSDDEQVKSVGRASLFYYLGRLQGRGDTANLSARLVDLADKMTEDDIKAQSKTCGGMFTAATQSLQDISHAFEQHFAGSGGAGAATK